MSDKLKLLLIDGNNMCHRVFHSNQDLAYKGKATGVLFGFYRQLISLHKDYPDHFRIIAWDGGYARRLAESKLAVEAGIVPRWYKQSRKEAAATRRAEKAGEADDIQIMFDQMDQLRVQLDKVKCLQAMVKGFEGDDIIYTYAEYVKKWGGEAIVVSSDKDFYQVISPRVSVYDAMMREMHTEERFLKEFEFSPSLWVDVGAFVGEVGACLGGDTKVKLLDGTSKAMKELCNSGEFWVYSCREDGTIEPAKATCRMTKRSPTVVVTIDNGERIVCTPNHLFMLRNGSYKTASTLVGGDSLMPLYERKDGRGYFEIFDNLRKGWIKVHSLVGKSVLAGKWDEKKRSIVIEGLDKAERQWLVVHPEHIAYHVRFNKERWQDPVWRAKMLLVCSVCGTNAFKKAWREKKEVMLANCSRIGTKYGGIGFKEYNKSEKHKLVAIKNITHYHSSPEFAEKRSEAAIKRTLESDYAGRMSIVGKKYVAGLNSDKSQIEKQLLGKVRKIVGIAIEKYGKIDKTTYCKCWKKGVQCHGILR